MQEVLKVGKNLTKNVKKRNKKPKMLVWKYFKFDKNLVEETLEKKSFGPKLFWNWEKSLQESKNWKK